MDYKKLGFKAGLEIHQQLDTKKLFCSCPSLLRKDEPDFEVKRKLHAVAGEEGSIDLAVSYESSLDKDFVYQGYDTTCLVELDEEPPHQINKEALKIALQVAVLLNCKILSLTQIMRKTVIDGSNTSGFQRSVLIGLNGHLETKEGKIGIQSIALEEYAARIVERHKDKAVFRLDRLGIPLIEIATEPDIKTPEQAKEVALQIGDILRSCKVKRGIGTIRQDVNISIEKHPRVEIKGVQDMDTFIKVIENEIKRQQENVKNNSAVSEVRNALPDATTEFLRPMPGSARMYPETDLPLLKIHLDLINEAKRDLPKLKSEIEEELRKQGLKEEIIKELLKRNKVEEFKALLKVVQNPSLIGNVLVLYTKEFASKLKKSLEEVESLIEEFASNVLLELKKDRISERDVKDILERIASGESLESALNIEKAELGELEERIHKIIKSKPGLSTNAYMGLVMKELRGKISGGDAMKIIQKFIH